MKRTLKKAGNVMKVILITIAVISIIFLLLRLVIRQTILYKSTSENEISEVQVIELDGVSQKVLLEGKSKDLPILITVHGGPGLPIPNGVAFRGQYPELTENYILIQWDQFGNGVNYATDTNLTIDNYVNMLMDLIKNIKLQFPGNKIYLYGMSWGTILNCKIANEIPDEIDGVIAYGQYTNIDIWKNAMNEELQDCNLTNKELDILEESIQGVSIGAFNKMLSLANKYTNLYYYKGNEASNWDFYMSCFHVFLSPDYALVDAIHAYSNPSADALFLKVMDIDMSTEHLQIKVPYLILQGEDDLITPIAYNEQLTKENPYISLKVFKNAGHIPTNTSFKEMWEAVIEFQKQKPDDSISTKSKL